jgi:hypothetical protein
MHIYDFITDHMQAGIKTKIRSENHDRFENILESYHSYFIQGLMEDHDNQESLSSSSDSDLLPIYFKGDKGLEKWFDDFLQIVRSESPMLDRLFQEVIDCYYLFIRGRHHTSVLKMYDILESFELLDDRYWVQTKRMIVIPFMRNM